MRTIFIALVAYSSLLFTATAVLAVSDPIATPNNKYGIHIIDESDLENAAALVNSSGGDWGYVTMVIRTDQRNVDQWNATFSRMRTLHLIPIIRLASAMKPDGSWEIPVEEDAQTWTSFLMQLRWVVKNRYIILFNEPNHAKEWGNTLAPEIYAKIVSIYALALKQASDDFYVLPAGLDASAPNGMETMDEAFYLRRMLKANPAVFDHIDGWASHSYPNPGFIGNVTDKGRGTLQTYQWELSLLHSLGVNKNLPVFITETGWPHQEGTQPSRWFATADDVADRFTRAATDIWSDSRIVAITPFVLNYPAYPFSNFSWQIPGLARFYPQFDSYRSIPKTAGAPPLVITPTPLPTRTLTPGPIVLGTETEPPPARTEQNSFLSRLKLMIRIVFPVFATPKQ